MQWRFCRAQMRRNRITSLVSEGQSLMMRQNRKVACYDTWMASCTSRERREREIRDEAEKTGRRYDMGQSR